MNVLEACCARIRGRGLRVVFPECADERIVAAAQRLRDLDLATPILLAHPETGDRLDAYAAAYLAGRPDANPKIARRLAAKPLFHAGLMVKTGDADAMVAGAANPTARVIEAAMLTIGLAPGITTPQMDLLVEKALRNGAEAAKVCGAGGGGCIAFLCDPKRKTDVERALAEEEGAEVLDWRVSREGLLVSQE